MLWVARDDDGSVGIFQAEPRWFEGEWISGNAGEYVGSMVRRVFPELKPGECRELRMVEPLDKGRERERFEAVWPLRDNHDEMDLHVQFEQWRAWLAAKRDERGG